MERTGGQSSEVQKNQSNRGIVRRRGFYRLCEQEKDSEDGSVDLQSCCITVVTKTGGLGSVVYVKSACEEYIDLLFSN